MGRTDAPILLLWDESQLWGLLAHRALAAWGFPARLVRGEDIAAGALAAGGARVLVVPGGLARRKAACLGPAALGAVWEFVAGGGTYLGFCGGAGLALSDEGGLGLCPWTRQPFVERLHHFLSGHIHVSPAKDDPLVPSGLPALPLVPVWWPGQFAPDGADGVSVLAAYGEPGEDFWVADLPLGHLPAEALADWEERCGLRLVPGFLAGRPCIVRGALGRGRYILSYAHLETPASPDANRWLAHMLSVLADVPAVPADKAALPEWRLRKLPDAWDDPALSLARQALEEIIRLGRNNLLLFWRNPWLLGWRRGIPGNSLNTLYAMIRQAQSGQPTDAALEFWAKAAGEFSRDLARFRRSVTAYLLAERLAMTMSREAPGAVKALGLKEQRAALFGPPPGSGGLCGRLQDALDELVRRLLS